MAPGVDENYMPLAHTRNYCCVWIGTEPSIVVLTPAEVEQGFKDDLEGIEAKRSIKYRSKMNEMIRGWENWPHRSIQIQGSVLQDKSHI